jgi:cytochrome b6-f complex iron-sulfur subunit
MLIVCRPSLEEEEFLGLSEQLAALPHPIRWAKKGDRLVLLVERARGDQTELSGIAENPAVEYVLRDPSESEIARIFSRRDLLNFALLSTGVLGGALVLGPIAWFATAPSEGRSATGDLFVGHLEDFQENSSRTQIINGREFLIIRKSGEHFYALAATCTHSDACLVAWVPERRQIVCPCHRGIFDVQGNVVSGPPPRPLASRPVVVREGKVYVRELEA